MTLFLENQVELGPSTLHSTAARFAEVIGPSTAEKSRQRLPGTCFKASAELERLLLRKSCHQTKAAVDPRCKPVDLGSYWVVILFRNIAKDLTPYQAL